MALLGRGHRGSVMGYGVAMTSLSPTPPSPLPPASLADETRRTRIVPAGLRPSDVGFALLVVAAGALLAEGVAAERWQYALTFAFVVTAAGLYVRWPTAGIAALLALWTFAAFFRRLLDYVTFSPPPDLLSLAPFLATAVIGLLALRRARPTRKVLIVIGVVWGGLLIGVALGFHSPLSMMYALFAYASATLALLIGYADWQRGRLVVERILLVLLPIIAGYGLYQYFVPGLPPWDQLWLKTTGFITVGTKEAHTFRFFSVMNSPATVAEVLTLLIAMLICSRRLSAWRLMSATLALVCLFLIGVRSAWVALAGALILITIVSGGRTLARLLVVPAVLVGGFYLVAGGTSAGNQATNRVSSLTSLSQDKSFRDRLQAITQYGPQAVAAPLGHGAGSVGQAALLNTSASPPPFVDNGYLLILWQFGPLGFLLIVGAAGYAIVYGARRTARARLPDRLSLLAPLLAVAVVMISGDALYGVTAVIFWYFCGALFAAAERPAGAGASDSTTRQDEQASWPAEQMPTAAPVPHVVPGVSR